ncbi:MAG: Nucleoside triphosphate pyrophosphohydrolase/pyrophosphatase MazG [Gemmatimonadaceae bacterium]|nr:Nucleoside triphosphate pyrophosphohydrolase/pyrophosphatase MazG [Gemmatimonadaceae bacterium]
MQAKATLEDTLALMRDLRARCEWDAAQTHDSLRPYLIEEAHELDEALRERNDSRIRDELGDVLLQVLFHSVVAEERGAFDMHDVSAGLIAKMRHRHPHLYGDGERQEWERLKAEKRRRIEDGLASGLPSLHRAHRLQDRASGIGFDWEDTAGPAAKVEEELREVRAHLRMEPSVPAASTNAELELELGDLLFAVVNLCRKAGVHASLALDRANAKFARRVAAIEALAEQRGIDVRTAGLAVLDALWNEAKAAERLR